MGDSFVSLTLKAVNQAVASKQSTCSAPALGSDSSEELIVQTTEISCEVESPQTQTAQDSEEISEQVDPELKKLDVKSDEIQEKLHACSRKRDYACTVKGFDHPTVKKLNKRLQILGKQLRKVSMQRYQLRNKRSL